MMEKLFLAAMLCWAVGACEDKQVAKAAALEADARWVNALPYDGCYWHFEVLQGDSVVNFTPTSGSIAAIERVAGLLNEVSGPIDVHMKYQPTGQKQKVTCGWGHTALYDEIEIHDIARR